MGTTKPTKGKSQKANNAGGDSKGSQSSFFASIYPGPKRQLPGELGATLAKLGAALGLPVWLLLQDDPEARLSELNAELVHLIRHFKGELPTEGPVALVVNSPGGNARAAYELGRVLCRRCGGFTAVVPDAAMSAATLLILGAEEVVMGPDAALGPLDAQLWDPEMETYDSVLNEVQALERLRAYALESIDATMFLLLGRTSKKIDSLLPHVLKFVSDTTRPLFEKIDVVHYNERARMLKVAEEYAVRLLRPRHPEPIGLGHPDVARRIASRLVENYPEHGFRIEREEAIEIGIPVRDLTDELTSLMEALWLQIQGVTAIGQLQEKEVDPSEGIEAV